jgi:hypothetical protein
MDRFKGKRIFIAPKTAMSKAFLEHLFKQADIDFLGFLDKVKEDNDVHRIEAINPDAADAIIIVSPNHYRQIFAEYLEYIPKEKLFVAGIEQQTYKLTQDIDTTIDDPIEPLSKAYDAANAQRTQTVFVSKGFIGSNNKFFYLHCLRQDISCVMVTDHTDQLEELKRHNLPCVELGTAEGNRLIAEARTLVFDQGNYTHFYISPNQTTIQLWHGVGLKKMAPHKHITYDYFISTSDWTNDTNFKHIFSAKQFLDYGYPRNDFLLQDGEDELDLLWCDKELYSLAKNGPYSRTLLYMPTTREYLFNSDQTQKDALLPLDLPALNSVLQERNDLLIIKLHPFVIDFFGEDLDTDSFSNILFHPAQGDIYPILKYTDILISDYSSVVYDFMLLDRPIILFAYDLDQYEQNMGGFLFDYDGYSPGIRANNQIELMECLKDDPFLSKPDQDIESRFFTPHRRSAVQRLQHLIEASV